MPQFLNPMQRDKHSNRQSGFAMASILFVIIVISILGGAALYNVRSDIRYTGLELDRERAHLLAQSAVDWAVREAGKPRNGELPFTKSTHSNTGMDSLPSKLDNGKDNNRKLLISDIDGVFPSDIFFDASGNVKQTNASMHSSLTGAASETISFKIWYPNDTTIRIQGFGSADGAVSKVDFKGTLVDTRIDL
jgi:type II secretory pathway pseudopilin PulG